MFKLTKEQEEIIKLDLDEVKSSLDLAVKELLKQANQIIEQSEKLDKFNSENYNFIFGIYDTLRTNNVLIDATNNQIESAYLKLLDCLDKINDWECEFYENRD